MKLKNIKDPTIAKEKYNFNIEIKKYVSYEKWVEYIEQHKDYYIWLEDTEEGKDILKNIDKIPKNFREGILIGHNKKELLPNTIQKKDTMIYISIM